MNEPVVVNPMVVAAAVWALGFLFKKIGWIPNDFIPAILNWVSQISAYVIAIGGAMLGTPVTFLWVSHAVAQVAAGAGVPPPAGADTAATGLLIYTATQLWDWLGRKLLWGKVLKKVVAKS